MKGNTQRIGFCLKPPKSNLATPTPSFSNFDFDSNKGPKYIYGNSFKAPPVPEKPQVSQRYLPQTMSNLRAQKKNIVNRSHITEDKYRSNPTSTKNISNNYVSPGRNYRNFDLSSTGRNYMPVSRTGTPGEYSSNTIGYKPVSGYREYGSNNYNLR